MATATPIPTLRKYFSKRNTGLWKTLVDPSIEYRHEFRRVYLDTRGIILPDSFDVFACAAMLCLDEFMRRTDISQKFSQNVFLEYTCVTAGNTDWIIKAGLAGAFLIQSGLIRPDTVSYVDEPVKRQVSEVIQTLGLRNAINALTFFEVGKFRAGWDSFTKSVPHLSTAEGIEDSTRFMTYGTAFDSWYFMAVLGLRRLHEQATKPKFDSCGNSMGYFII